MPPKDIFMFLHGDLMRAQKDMGAVPAWVRVVQIPFLFGCVC